MKKKRIIILIIGIIIALGIITAIVDYNQITNDKKPLFMVKNKNKEITNYYGLGYKIVVDNPNESTICNGNVRFGFWFYTRKVTMTKCENKDGFKFKKEYETLNGKEVPNSTNVYRTLTIDANNPIIYADFNKVMETLNGTGIIYFGFPECPWCRSALPVLLESSKEIGIEKIYYANFLSIRDKKHLDENGKVVTDQEGTPEYYQLLDKLGSSASVYAGLNDNSIRRLYFPTVVTVKDGKIIDYHEATVDSQDNPYTDLTSEQKNELKNKYIDMMNKVIKCDEAC